MVTAVFTDNDDYARTYGLWQWDYGQQLRIEGLHLPTAVEIHFALQETGGEAIPRVGTTKDGVTTVTIPDSMLEGNSTVWTADKAYNIYAWVYLSDKSSGETIKRITMQVKSRPKPEAFEAPGDGEIFHEAIEAVNDAAKRAEEAGDKAVVAAEEAKAAATQTAEHLQATEGLAEQVETNADTVAQDKQTVAGMLSQTQQVASEAVLSAQAAKLSETAAVQAQTGAEAAEDGARQYAEETGADRQAVANDKQTVTQMREAVAADRQAVEQTALQFGQTSQDALTAIGQAQSTAVGDVKAEGQKQTTAVQEAGTQAVSEVTEAKTTAVQAVTTEGDTQTKRVEDAAAGIIADREQISQNKTDIAGLVEGMTDLAPAIHSTASGSVITANDAAEGRPFRGMRVFGRSIQDGTPSVENPVPIVNVGESGSIKVGVLGKNLVNIADFVVETINSGTGFAYAPDDLTNQIKALPNGTYSISYEFDGDEIRPKPNRKITFYDSLDNMLIGINNVFVLTDDLRSKIAKTIVYGTKGTNITFRNIILVNGSTIPMIYSPYRDPQTLTLATPNGLPGIPVTTDGNYTDADGQQWVCDEIDLGRGKYVQRVKKINVKSLSGYNLSENFGSIKVEGILSTQSRVPVMSNRFAFETSIKDDGTCFAYGDVIRLYYNLGSLENFNKWLTDNDVVVWYPLDTFIETDLPPEEIAAYKALRTYGPTTVITNDAGVHMEVTYVADTKNYIRNLEQRLSAKLVNIQSALISQKTSGGGYLTIADSSPLPVEEFSMTGKTEQMKTTGKNLLKPNDHNVYHELPLKAGTVVTLMTNGQLSEGGNIKFIGMENENVWFSIDKGQTRVCRSIGNKDVKGFYNLLTKKEGLEYMLAIGDVKIFEPYSGSFPSPSPDWEQPIEITDQPITITIKGGTEQQSITLTPPRPFTKWDRLEKIDGVWCWVYQSKVLSGAEIKKNFVGMHNSGSMMIKISTLGAMDEQNDAVSDKFIYSTQSVSTLKNGEFRIIYGNAYLKIDGITTDEEGRQWLESNDIIIIAQASAPEYIPLAASEQAQLNALTMYAGTTEITNNGGCTMELTYTADTKTYIDNKLAAISAAMIGGT